MVTIPSPAQAVLDRIPPAMKGERRLKSRQCHDLGPPINLLLHVRWGAVLPVAGFEVMEVSLWYPYHVRPISLNSATDYP